MQALRPFCDAAANRAAIYPGEIIAQKQGDSGDPEIILFFTVTASVSCVYTGVRSKQAPQERKQQPTGQKDEEMKIENTMMKEQKLELTQEQMAAMAGGSGNPDEITKEEIVRRVIKAKKMGFTLEQFLATMGLTRMCNAKAISWELAWRSPQTNP